jgi:tyrosyl-tRNA synthetase
MLTPEVIETNIQSIQKVFSKYLTFGEGPTDALLVRNGTWLSDLNYLDFLGEYGRCFSINRMLSFDSVKLRLDREQPLSFLEFNYMILQAYDFLELYRRHKCTLQFGGSDQWGNIVSGIDLIRRLEHQEAYGLTAPLITTSDGQKMGKSAQGALWLNSDMLSSYDYWQFWRNVTDADVGRFLRLYTDLPLEKITELEALTGSDKNQAKIILADEATRLCHGDDAVHQAHETASSLFATGPQSVEMMFKSLPQISITKQNLDTGYSLVDALIGADLAASKGDARRLIRGQGCKVNDEIITDEHHLLSLTDLQPPGYIKLTAGKKRHGLVRLA